MSFRLKTILGVALIEAALLSFLIYSMMGFLHDASQTQLNDYIRLTRGSAISMTKDAVLSSDLARLAAFTDEIRKSPGIVYARILDVDGQELAWGGDGNALNRRFVPDEHLDQVADGVYDLYADIEIHGVSYGRVEMGVDVSYLQQLTDRAKWSSLGVAGLEMVLVALFSFMLGTYLTRQLKQLSQAAARLGEGEYGYQVPVQGRDEVAQTTRVFNDMSRQLLLHKEQHESYSKEVFALMQQLDTVLNMSPDGYVYFDEAGLVSSVNRAVERITGLPLGKLMGMDMATFVEQLRLAAEPDQPFPLADILWLVLTEQPAQAEIDEGKASTAPMILRLRTPRVSVLQCNFARAGRGSVLYLHDVTHLTELDRMKSEFLATAAHELRTPMASVVGFSELLLNREFDEATTKDFLGTIHRQGLILTDMLNQLLDLARIEARTAKTFDFRPHSLEELLRECLGTTTIGQDGHVVTLVIPYALPQLMMDKSYMRRVFMNLLSNAFKYSPHGGEVLVRADSWKDEGGQGWVRVSVSDQGIGMTEEQVSRIFERFYRADDSGQIPGTGLGMSITKEIVSLHHGEISIQSTPGVGTTVTVSLPLSQ